MPFSTPTLAVAALLAIAPSQTPAPVAQLSGPWRLALDPGFNEEPATFRCDLSQEGPDLTLECNDLPVIGGTLDGRTVKFVVMTGRDNLLEARFTGRLGASDATIVGTWRLEDTTGNRIGRFTAAKE